ncbi:MAG: alpha/beta hydrolase [Thiohalocapsa sp.]
MTIVHANGLDFHAKAVGEGPPLFMLHGLLFDNLSSWYFAAGRLSENHRLLLYDLRGHGRSELAPSGYALASMASDLAAMADALAPGEAFDLAGFSYGSLTALTFALANPDRVKRLILVEAPLPPFEDLVKDLRRADLASLLRNVPPHVLSALMSNPKGLAALTKRVNALAKRTTIVQDVRGEAPLDERLLRALDVPTLLIYGRDSDFVDDGRYLAETLRHARLDLIDGTHMLLHENAPQTVAQMQDFLTI